MAEPDRQFPRLFWREKKEPIFASAQRVDLKNSRMVQQVLNYRQEWQTQAINNVSAIGELQYGVSTPASLVARVVLFAAEPASETDAQPVRVKGNTRADKLAKDTMERLGNSLTRIDFQFDLAVNFLVTGEAYVVCFGERPGIDDPTQGGPLPATPERWVVRSIAEAEKAAKSIKVWDDLTNQMVVLDPDKGDTFIRVWRPDPFAHMFATSHIRSILGPAEELLWWDAAASAAAKNRITKAGMVGVPSNLELPSETADDVRFSGVQRFVNKFLQTMGLATQNPQGSEAAVPLIFTYPYNESGKSGVEVIEFTRPQDELMEARTNRSLQRIEQGINLPAGVISGLGQATHWGGGQIEECLAPETRVLTADLRWIPVGDLKVDDEIAAFTEDYVGHVGRTWKKARVEKAGRAELDCYEVVMADGTKFVASARHQWLFKANPHRVGKWVTTEWLAQKMSDKGGYRELGPRAGIVKPIEPWDEDTSWEAGYLAGVFDGEGYISKATPLILGMGQRENECLEMTEVLSTSLGFNFARYGPLSASVNGDVIQLNLRGGIREIVRFLGQVRPPRLFAKWDAIGGPDTLGRLHCPTVPVVSVTPVGKREVVTLKTSTGTLIAEGYAHHNSVFRDHIEPLVLFICSALTRTFLQPILRESGISNWDDYLVWYDASSLIVHRDKAANAQRAVEVGAINLPAYRRELGFSENDAPTPAQADKLLEWLSALRRGTGPKSDEGQDPNAPPQENEPGDRTPVEQRAAPLKGKGQSPLPAPDEKLAASASSNGHSIDSARITYTALQVLCDERCRRALERAGNRLRNRAKKMPAYASSIKSVPATEVAATLGRETCTKLGISDLFDDAFTDFHSAALAQLPSEIPALATTHPFNTLTNDLRLVCAERLFDPPTTGHIVPPKIIAKALIGMGFVDEQTLSA